MLDETLPDAQADEADDPQDADESSQWNTHRERYEVAEAQGATLSIVRAVERPHGLGEAISDMLADRKDGHGHTRDCIQGNVTTEVGSPLQLCVMDRELPKAAPDTRSRNSSTSVKQSAN